MAAEYFTEAWLAMFREQAQKLLDASAKPKAALNFSLAEWVTDPESARRPPWIGLRLEVTAGHAVVLPLALPDRSADVRVAFPYALGYRLSRLPAGPEFDALVAKGVSEGAIKLEGDPSRSPFEGHSLHDAIAANTL
ncbi:MAG: hypothetical protein WDM91_22860 [Rhizomicrobium sp.]